MRFYVSIHEPGKDPVRVDLTGQTEHAAKVEVTHKHRPFHRDLRINLHERCKGYERFAGALPPGAIAWTPGA